MDLVQHAPALELGEGPLCGGSQACKGGVGQLLPAVAALALGVERIRVASVARLVQRQADIKAPSSSRRRSSPEAARASARLEAGAARASMPSLT